MAKAAIAAGADGLLIEAHPNPAEARCDGPQSIAAADLAVLAREVERIANAVDRTIQPEPVPTPLPTSPVTADLVPSGSRL